MQKTTLYKEGCEPYVVDSQEALEYHLNQGWSTSKGVMKAAPTTVATGLVAGTDVSVLKNRIVELEGQLDKAVNGGDVEKIRELNDIISAKDQQITDMQSDFEEITGQMSKTIQELKDQAAANVKPTRGKG